MPLSAERNAQFTGKHQHTQALNQWVRCVVPRTNQQATESGNRT